MEYTYKDKEIGFARHIKDNPPHKIWWDFISYFFDYGEFYYQIECTSEIADTQNEADEAIVGKFTRHPEPYFPDQNAKLVCQGKKIEAVYIARAFLHFTTNREYSRLERFFNRSIQQVKNIVTGKKDPIGDIVSQTLGGYEEITCHPKSEEAKNANPVYSNLIDCGLLIQIDGKFLKAFAEGNGFGFHIWNDKYFHDYEELKDTFEEYEFIEV